MWHSKQVGVGTAKQFREGPTPPRFTIVILGLSLMPTIAGVRSLLVISGELSIDSFAFVSFVISMFLTDAGVWFFSFAISSWVYWLMSLQRVLVGGEGSSAITGSMILAPVVGRFFRLGTGRPSTVVLFEYKSFCRACSRSTVITSRVLNVALAGQTGKRTGDMRVTNFPFRTLSACLPGLMHTNGQITVYSRLRSPGVAGGLMGHNVARLIAPNMTVGSGILSCGRGGFLTTIRFKGTDYNITFLSVSANRFLATRKPFSCVSGLLGGFTPGRILFRHNGQKVFRKGFKDGFFAFRLSS